MRLKKLIQCLLVTFLIGFIKYYLMDYQVIIFFGNVTHKTIQTALHLYFSRIIFIVT